MSDRWCEREGTNQCEVPRETVPLHFHPPVFPHATFGRGAFEAARQVPAKLSNGCGFGWGGVRQKIDGGKARPIYDRRGTKDSGRLACVSPNAAASERPF